MNANRRLAVLTSGGDAPGMNPAIRAVVRAAVHQGSLVYGFHDGFTGLLAPHFRVLHAHDVAGLTSRAGTILGTAREPRMLETQWQRQALETLKEHQFDGLIVIGGSGSQQGAAQLSELGFPVVGIPSTIDNDLPCTETSLGVDTAVNTAVACVDMIKETMTSHRRIAVIQVMGRGSGYLAEQVALATGAEAVVVPERPVNAMETLRQLAFQRMVQHHERHMIIIVAEGSTKPSSSELTEYLSGLGYAVRLEVLGYLQRGGKPTAYDRILGARLGVAAVDALLEGNYGIYLTVHGNEIGREPYASARCQECKVRDEVLDLIARLE
ncbi:MAG: ATP-dependent 6-phosphofructokinase [Ktedonobacterales bacterium]